MEVDDYSDGVCINVGTLESIPSLCYHISEPLRQLADICREGDSPELTWDLSHILPKRQSIAALTAFLSVAATVSRYMNRPAYAHYKWDPAIISFWNSISLPEITTDNKILQWNENIGYRFHNRKSQYMAIIPFLIDDYPRPVDRDSVSVWKDVNRAKLTDCIYEECTQLFSYYDREISRFNKTIATVSLCAAELVVNALLHGRTTTFLGLQSSRKGVTVAVCDAGRGFQNSMKSREFVDGSQNLLTNMNSLLLGSLLNRESDGLRSSIGAVTSGGGYVLMSSFEAEIRWTQYNWLKVLEKLGNSRLKRPLSIYEYEDFCGVKPRTGAVDSHAKKLGYARIWPTPLVGSRISFEMPI